MAIKPQKQVIKEEALELIKQETLNDLRSSLNTWEHTKNDTHLLDFLKELLDYIETI